jgi:hypothetical protein
MTSLLIIAVGRFYLDYNFLSAADDFYSRRTVEKSFNQDDKCKS